MKLTQKQLLLLLSILSQVQLMYKDSKEVNVIIEILQSTAKQPKPEDVTIIPVEQSQAERVS